MNFGLPCSEFLEDSVVSPQTEGVFSSKRGVYFFRKNTVNKGNMQEDDEDDEDFACNAFACIEHDIILYMSKICPRDGMSVYNLYLVKYH